MIKSMMAPTSRMKFCALIVISAILSLTTGVLGALPLLVARRVGGRNLFWVVQLVLTGLFAVTGLPFYAILVLAETALVGLYVEVEEHGGDTFTSGAVAILGSMGASLLAGAIWMKIAKLHVADELRQQIEPIVLQISSIGSGNTMTSETILQQLPSAAIIAMIIGLAIALVGERRLTTIMKLDRRELAEPAAIGAESGAVGPLPTHATAVRAIRLLDFRLPDWMVWVVVAAIAGAFLKHGKPWAELISVNALNVLVILYFFQGIAVIAQAFRTYKVGTVWQAIWYVILVLQLFLMVSLLGFADYWLEFRERLARKPAEPKRSF